MHALNMASRWGNGVGAERILLMAWNFPQTWPIREAISSDVFSWSLYVRPKILRPSRFAFDPGSFEAIAGLVVRYEDFSSFSVRPIE